MREGEAKRAELERRSCSERLRDLVMATSSLDVVLESSRSLALALEEQRVRKEAELLRLNDELHTANCSLQKSDVALDRAVANNEDLRRQMEGQRMQVQSKCSSAICDCSAEFEAEVAKLLAVQRMDAESLADQLEDLKDRAAVQAAEATRLHLAVERSSEARSALQRECALWKAQGELASRLHMEVKQDVAQARSDWGRQLLLLREQQDTLMTKQLALQDELRSSKSAFAEFSCATEVRASEVRAEAVSFNAKIQEAGEELGVTRHALQEKAAALAAVRGEASTLRARALEERNELEQQLQQLVQVAARTREWLTLEAGTERQRAQRAELECEEIRQRDEPAPQGVLAEPLAAQAAALERELHGLHERHRLDARQAELAFGAGRRHSEALEAELARQRELLEAAERQLQASTADLRTARAERTGTHEALRADLAAGKEKLAVAREHCSRLAGEVSEKQRLAADEKARLERELAELAAAREQQDRMHIELDRQMQELEAAETENWRLRLLAGDARGSEGASRAVPPGADPRWEVQDSISRMQRRTDQLRRELQQRQGITLSW